MGRILKVTVLIASFVQVVFSTTGLSPGRSYVHVRTLTHRVTRVGLPYELALPSSFRVGVTYTLVPQETTPATSSAAPNGQVQWQLRDQHGNPFPYIIQMTESPTPSIVVLSPTDQLVRIE